MLFSENIFFLFYFTVPGCAYVLYNKYIRFAAQKETDEVARVSGAVFFSFFAFMPNYLLAQLFLYLFPSTWIIPSIAANIIVSFALCFFWNFCKKEFIEKTRNIFSDKKMGLTNYYDSMWTQVFYRDILGENRVSIEIPPISISDYSVVSININGEELRGCISSFSDPKSENKVILLESCALIDSFFEYDKETSGEKFFDTILYKYVDLTDGYSITFYDTTKYAAYMNAKNPATPSAEAVSDASASS